MTEIQKHLPAQQLRCKINIIRSDLSDVQSFGQILSVEGAEQSVGRQIAQLLSCIGIDMAHHQIDICLRQMVETGPLGQHAPDHFMGDFAAALLVRTLRITIKDFRAEHAVLITFNG